MNWTVIIIVGIICLAIIVFTFLKDSKEEKQFEDNANQEYPWPHHNHTDADPEETTK